MIFKRFLILGFILVTGVFQNLFSQNLPVASSTEISLLTCEPGNELYAKFGHTAIRVNDSVNHIDWAFNYGIFSFNTPNFYGKFVSGQTDYMLGVYDTGLFLSEYRDRGTKVWEQCIDLDTLEKSVLIRSLIENTSPENRMYRYNFVFDNCATRPVDKIREALDHTVRVVDQSNHDSYRTLILSHLNKDPWSAMGISLIFGMKADLVPVSSATNFLPLLLKTHLAHTYILEEKGQLGRKLVKCEKVMLEGKSKEFKSASWINAPWIVFALFLIVAVFITVWKKRTRVMSKTLDTVWLTATGLTGILICFLMFFSEHPLVGNNLNLLWMNPLNLPAAYLIWRRTSHHVLFFYFLIYLVLLVSFMLLSGFLFQEIPHEVYALFVVVFFRTARRLKRLANKLFVKTNQGYKWKSKA